MKVNLQKHKMDFLAKQVCNPAVHWEMLSAFPSDLSGTIFPVKPPMGS